MRPYKFGIIGHRSWLARALTDVLPSPPLIFHKEEIQDDSSDMSAADLVFCFGGRARGDADDRRKELSLIRSLCRMDGSLLPNRLVYISSRDVHLASHYGELKRRCEALLQESYRSYQLVIVRPPAIFGEGQALDSQMLIPSIIREGRTFTAQTPDQKSKFVHVDRFTSFLISLAAKDVGGVYDKIPGEFSLRPRDLVDLFRSFDGLQKRRAGGVDRDDAVIDQSDRSHDSTLGVDVITEHRPDR